MTHNEWLELMQFPAQWVQWGLIPDELAVLQLSGYQPGHESASEHDRHGAFQWWLKQSPPKETLIQLARLSWLDPDQLMGASVRDCILKQNGTDEEVKNVVAQRPAP